MWRAKVRGGFRFAGLARISCCRWIDAALASPRFAAGGDDDVERSGAHSRHALFTLSRKSLHIHPLDVDWTPEGPTIACVSRLQFGAIISLPRRNRQNNLPQRRIFVPVDDEIPSECPPR